MVAVAKGPFLTDPTFIPRRGFPLSGVNIRSLANVTNNSSAPDFWAALAARGAAVDTNFVANTYKTLASISSSNKGVLMAGVGPVASGAQTTTWRITLDGAVYTFTQAVNANERCVFGFMANDAIFTTAALFFDNKIAGTTLCLIPENAIYQSFLPTAAVSFNDSMLVEIKHSASISGTGSAERQSGVQYSQAT